jgi:hypothetical protein
MKKNFLPATISLIISAIPMLFHCWQASVIGRIIPSTGADAVTAVALGDTLHHMKRSVIINGRFDMDLRPGIYKITIEGHMSYRDYTFDSVEVKPGKITNLGDIRVQ